MFENEVVLANTISNPRLKLRNTDARQAPHQTQDVEYDN